MFCLIMDYSKFFDITKSINRIIDLIISKNISSRQYAYLRKKAIAYATQIFYKDIWKSVGVKKTHMNTLNAQKKAANYIDTIIWKRKLIKCTIIHEE